MRLRVEGFWVAQKLGVEVIAFTSVTLTALGGFLIPGWDIVLNLLQESGKETVLVVWAWKFINFRPPLDQKGETVS